MARCLYLVWGSHAYSKVGPAGLENKQCWVILQKLGTFLNPQEQSLLRNVPAFLPAVSQNVHSYSPEVPGMHRAALEASSQRTFKHALPHADGHEKGGVTVLDLKDLQHGHRQLLVDRGKLFIFLPVTYAPLRLCQYCMS